MSKTQEDKIPDDFPTQMIEPEAGFLLPAFESDDLLFARLPENFELENGNIDLSFICPPEVSVTWSKLGNPECARWLVEQDGTIKRRADEMAIAAISVAFVSSWTHFSAKGSGKPKFTPQQRPDLYHKWSLLPQHQPLPNNFPHSVIAAQKDGAAAIKISDGADKRIRRDLAHEFKKNILPNPKVS